MCFNVFHVSAFFNGGGGDLNPGERHSRVTQADGTVTFCTLRATTGLVVAHVLVVLKKQAMSHSGDGPGVTAPLRTNIVPLTGKWQPPAPPPSPSLKSPRKL